MEASLPPKKERIPGWVKRVVPVLVSIGILFYYFHDQNWEEFFNACGRVTLWVAVLAIVIPQVFQWFMGTLLTERYFKWFHGPFPFWKYFWVHGASYILMFVNTALGGGGLLLYQQRKGRITWTKLMGMITFRILIVLGVMCFPMAAATLGMHYYGLAENVKINMYVWWAVLIFSMVWFTESWIVFHHGKFFGITKLIFRDKNSEFMTASRLATRRQWLLTFAMSIPNFILALVGYYFLNRAFNVNVPFLEFIVVAPIALLIANLPIAFGGFGTTTYAWMTFFGDYGTRDDIAALTLFIPFTRAVCRAVIGLISLKPALNEINALIDEPEDGKESVLEAEEAEF